MTQQEQDRTHELVGLLKDQCPVDGRFGDDPQCCWFHEAALALSRLLDEQARLERVIAGFYALLDSDKHAVTFQTMGQCRTSLLDAYRRAFCLSQD